jgi:hypothetical protein
LQGHMMYISLLRVGSQKTSKHIVIGVLIEQVGIYLDCISEDNEMCESVRNCEILEILDNEMNEHSKML